MKEWKGCFIAEFRKELNPRKSSNEKTFQFFQFLAILKYGVITAPLEIYSLLIRHVGGLLFQPRGTWLWCSSTYSVIPKRLWVNMYFFLFFILHIMHIMHMSWSYWHHRNLCNYSWLVLILYLLSSSHWKLSSIDSLSKMYKCKAYGRRPCLALTHYLRYAISANQWSLATYR